MNTRINTLGLLCPLPVLKIQKLMRSIQSGEKITVIADDPNALIDIPFYCKENGHQLVKQNKFEDFWEFEIQKK